MKTQERLSCAYHCQFPRWLSGKVPHLPVTTYCVLCTSRGLTSPVEASSNLGQELPLQDLHFHSLRHWLRCTIRSKHVIIGNGYLTLVTVIVIFHELLGHLDGSVTLSAEVEKRKEYDCCGQFLPGILLVMGSRLRRPLFNIKTPTWNQE